MKRRKKSPLTAYCCRENKFIMIDQHFPTTINMPNMINTLDSFRKHECRIGERTHTVFLTFCIRPIIITLPELNTLKFK
jgi:hypothetical protein